MPKDAQVIGARGKFLIPGLWDMHAHWSQKDYRLEPILGAEIVELQRIAPWFGHAASF